jgi:hypothetical protein
MIEQNLALERLQKMPFRVSHTNGNIVAGFNDIASAEEDAKQRNQRSLNLGMSARYIALEKPVSTPEY